MTLAQAHALLPASTLVGDGTTRIGRVHSDTRTLERGDLFVALKGERFDGHAMLVEAKTQGAVAALAERGLAEAGFRVCWSATRKMRSKTWRAPGAHSTTCR